MINKYFIVLIGFIITVLVVNMVVIYEANAQSIKNITINVDNSNRREYTYCPITDQLAKTNIQVNGCPLVRVYVNDWNSLTEIEKNSIDNKLRILGFVDVSEHYIK